ncbi:carboxypeptidase M32 [Neogemmobacter tilapiae]|uniref:Metal-dependent carboxypeptidase n=1 Tax=Neogemmobacter tilapiae TaxID=875041 RepID=A0A918TX61_9RHOB|nr:carboxypeptidase M32 [Gemmobacter tilapiae]GHC62935.1 carboxypeptidase Taq [Gemmobacter tilapiae]
MTVYDQLMAHERQTQLLASVAERLGWDQETMMPPGAADQRGDEMAALELVLHARRTDPQIGEWLAAVKPEGAEQAAQLGHVRHSYERAVKVPARLAEELARICSTAQGVWAKARAEQDVAAFLPVLKQVLALKREEAACYADSGHDLYDGLLDGFEPGETGAGLAAMFDRMRPRLVALRGAILDKPAPKGLTGHFPKDKQLALSRELAQAFGYDFNFGRLDLAVHPFMSGQGADVRITTRVDESDPFNCIYSTIHEVGHAMYEGSVSPALRMTPAGRGVSMGVHESQSRIFENQLGRSPAFADWLFGRMRDTFGEAGAAEATAFARAVNRVRTGYIRTEADEIHYNLHVMLRFDLERALIKGDLEVADLEAAWNDRYQADFGQAVDKPSNGMLQDVHWSAGLFGYFPTYTLGNVYAGCLHKALRAELPDLDAQMAAGDMKAATGWLRDKVQVHGGLFTPRGVIEQAAGHAPDEGPLLDYLEAKFGALYGL